MLCLFYLFLLFDLHNKVTISVQQLLVQNCEKNLRGHQVYRDSYMAVSDWLAVTTDKLNMCRDVCGDLTTVESCLHKVQVAAT